MTAPASRPRILVLATGGTIAGQAGDAMRADYRPGQIGIETYLEQASVLGIAAEFTGRQIANIGSEDIDASIWSRLHTEIDLANPKSNKNTHGFTAEERAGFDAFVKAGFLDSFREFEPAGGHYTWWSNLNNARARNVGWRIDYFMVSANLRPRLKKAFILPQVMGSDHCPVGIELA